MKKKEKKLHCVYSITQTGKVFFTIVDCETNISSGEDWWNDHEDDPVNTIDDILDEFEQVIRDENPLAEVEFTPIYVDNLDVDNIVYNECVKYNNGVEPFTDKID